MEEIGNKIGGAKRRRTWREKERGVRRKKWGEKGKSIFFLLFFPFFICILVFLNLVLVFYFFLISNLISH